MSGSFYYIADGKAHFYHDGKDHELRSRVLDSYIEKIKDSSKRNEWKYTGTGAAFTGQYQAGADAESRVSSIYSKVNCIREYNGELFYSLTIDRLNGIYKKSKEDAFNDGIVISSADNAHYTFDIRNGKMVMDVAFAGESHIAVMDLLGTSYDVYTEGHSWDSSPVWSANDPSKIYFCCAGLPIIEKEPPEHSKQKSYGELVSEMYAISAARERGASSICLLDIERGEMDEILADEKYDYLYPQSMPDGSLYYLRRPHNSTVSKPSAFGCLLDILMLPVRLIGALFGFLNVFSAKYSGKTLSKDTDVKNRDEAEVFIDGNLINAEKELKANKSRGEKNPGIIPHSWELRCLDASGQDKLIRAGVAAYRAEGDGSVIFSNGLYILKRSGEGKEEVILRAGKVTAMY